MKLQRIEQIRMENKDTSTYKNGDYKRYFVVNDKLIGGFFEQYRFLSNFHECEVWWDGLIWPSSEHAYMASKCESYYQGFDKCPTYDEEKYEYICQMSCSEVKKWGRTVKLRDDWEKIKLDMMFQICESKFTTNKDLKQKLLATGDKELIEYNSWGDQFWGYDVDKQKGRNELGKVLMKIRGMLKLENILDEHL